MKRHTKLSIQWFYDLLEKGECDIVDFKEHFDDRDARYTGGFLNCRSIRWTNFHQAEGNFK